MTTLCLSHRKNEKCGLKEYVKIVSTKQILNETSSNEKFISGLH